MKTEQLLIQILKFIYEKHITKFITAKLKAIYKTPVEKINIKNS